MKEKREHVRKENMCVQQRRVTCARCVLVYNKDSDIDNPFFNKDIISIVTFIKCILLYIIEESEATPWILPNFLSDYFIDIFIFLYIKT